MLRVLLVKPVFTVAGGRRSAWLRAPVLVALGFVAAILIGAILLSLPAAVAAGRPGLTLIQALFMSTSATCVTGLSVVSVAQDLSLMGQAILLGLVQVGGLGIMTLAFLVFLSFGVDTRSGGEVLSSTLTEFVYRDDPRRALAIVVGGTLLIEILGALVLLPALEGESNPIWTAFFLSVCAFCNAGFDNLDHGMLPYAGSYSLGLPLLVLWLIGGIGFIVPVALAAKLRRGDNRTLDLTAAMILRGSAVLILLGAWLFWFTERQGLLARHSAAEQLLLCFFQGNAPRTAGFSMVDLGEANRLTLLTQIPLMLIGCGPGSTGGGVKITAAWVFVAVLVTRLVGREAVVIGRRTIPVPTIRHAVIICVAIVVAHGTLTLAMTGLEPTTVKFEAIAFEVASALGTVGLSAGITPRLSPESDLVLVLAMFVGRLGPLSFVYAFVRQRPRPPAVGYPISEIYVG